MQKIKSNISTFTRLALGAIFVEFGLNGFFNFIPLPPPEGAAAAFMGGLGAAGYFFPLLKITEILLGVALLTNVFVPLALIVLAPISINILAMHLFLAPSGLPLALMIVGLQSYLAWKHREAFRGVLAVHSSVEHSQRRPAYAAR